MNVVLFPLFFLSAIQADGIFKMLMPLRMKPQLEDLELIVTQITGSIRDISCVSVISDSEYVETFGAFFYSALRDVPSFLIHVKEEEDLLSPNYHTLKVIEAVRRSDCHMNVILMQNAEMVGRFLRFGDRHRDLDTRSNFILLYDRKLLVPDLHYLWKKIVNVVFLRKFASRPGVRPWYEIFTVPFPAPIPEVLYLRRLDLWRGSVFKYNSLLFRDKTIDLRGKMLRAVTFPHMPAAYKMPAPSLKSDVHVEGHKPIGFTGVEIEVLLTLSRAMNFEVDVYEAPGDERWGSQSNGTTTGVRGEILSGRADVALADLHYTPYNLKFMDLTVPYTSQCLTFLTPEALTDNSWQTLILPFKGYMWTGVLITLVAGSITFYILAKCHQVMEEGTNTQLIEVSSRGVPLKLHNNLTAEPVHLEGLYQFVKPDNSLLYTYSMLLLVSLPKLPAGWSLRVLTGCWWLYSILVVVAYRASMTAILANPVPRVTIDTLDQLAESKIAAGGWDEQTKAFFQTSVDLAGKKVGSTFEIDRDIDRAVARVANGKFAFYENIHFLQYARVRRQLLALEAANKKKNISEPRDDRNLHVMTDCVINMPISIGLQRNSPFKPRVDRYLRLITEGGLAQKWLRDAMTQVLAVDRSQSTTSQKALMNLKKFHGAMVALAAGLTISILAILIEIIFWQWKVVRNPNYDRFANAIIMPKKVHNSETSINNSVLNNK